MPFLHAGLPCASLDSITALWFRARLTPAFADLLWGLSGPGSEWVVTSLLLLAAGLLTWRRAWYALGALLLTVPGGALLGETLKLLVQRHRPFVGGPFGEWGGYSFPSGHTIAATLLYGSLLLLLLPLVKGARPRLALVAASLLVVLGVAFSRVALGAHYLSDVLAAMLIGILWLGLCSTAALALKRRRRAIARPPLP